MSLSSPSRACLLAAPLLGLLGLPAMAASPTVVNVVLDHVGDAETIKLDRTSVPAGPVEFRVTNAAVEGEHEMIVVKTDLRPDQFPTNKDRSRVDERKFKGAKELSDLKPGGTGKLDMKLVPGHYVLFCNIKNHFKDGMYAEMTVTE